MFNWKEAAGVGPVFVNTAEGGAVGVLLQERTFEDQFATRAATIALAPAQREGRDGVFFTKIRDHEATQFALGLARAQFGVRNLTRTDAPREACFERGRVVIQNFAISWYNSMYFFAAAAQELSTVIPLSWIFCHSSGRA